MRIKISILFIVFALCSCISKNAPVQTEASVGLATQEAASAINSLPPINISEQIEFSMLSPDGTKTIQTTDWVTYEILSTSDNKVIWSFVYDRAKFAKEEEWKYLHEAGYTPFYWSANGKYIYVSAHQGWDGGVKYFGNAFGAENGVARFDVDTGMMTDILPETHGGFYTFSISPDGNNIVYTYQNETPIVLRMKDLSTMEEKSLLTFNDKILDVGDFVWLPDMDQLVFQAMGSNGNSFLLLDIESLKVEIIIREFKEPINFTVWKDQSKLFYTNWKGEVWQLDLDKKTLNAIGVVTPNP